MERTLKAATPIPENRPPSAAGHQSLRPCSGCRWTPGSPRWRCAGRHLGDLLHVTGDVLTGHPCSCSAWEISRTTCTTWPALPRICWIISPPCSASANPVRTRSTVWLILARDWSELSWISSIMPAISSVACAVRSDSLRTSSATTAKPRPVSPARAASIARVQGQQIGLIGDVLITCMMLEMVAVLSASAKSRRRSDPRCR